MKKLSYGLVLFAFTLGPIHVAAASDSAKETASYQNEKGVRVEFVASEVLFRPQDLKNAKKELAEFLARTGGRVVGDDTVPPPPPQLQIKLDPVFTQPSLYVIQVDLSRVSTDATELESIHASSESAAKLLALVAKERKAGVNIAFDHVYQPALMLRRTEEQASGSGFDNAFDRSEFRPDGNRSNVSQAWQFVAGRGVERRTAIAIIDTGFWLDDMGRSLSRDLPEHPVQYDFADNDYIAGSDVSHCEPTACAHGTAMAHAAVAIVNNRYGTAGSGGLTADPFLFKYDRTDGTLVRAVRTAVAWHADIISMSFSSPGGGLFEGDYSAPYRDARAAGIVSLAAAGNSGENVDDVTLRPCTAEGVLCIGGLGDGVITSDDHSGYGASVDLWAPFYGTVVMPGDDPAAPSLADVAGTSFSTPFVAGVVSMMKAVNPSLSPDDVARLLGSTAGRDSTDPKVTRLLNAFEAVRAAASYRMHPDPLEPNDGGVSVTSPMAGTYTNLTLDRRGDADAFRFTVSGYSDFRIDLDFLQSLGPMSASLIKETAAGWAPTLTATAQPTGLRYTAASLPAGTYLLRISGSEPNVYNLSTSLVPHPLEPDSFENNDSAERASDLAAASTVSGTATANLHAAGDVDYYRFNAVVGGFVLGEEFRIVSSEVPLNVTLYRASGEMLDSSSTRVAANETGSYLVRVSGSQPGRYRFQLRTLTNTDAIERFHRSIYLPDYVPYWVNPGDPGPDVLKQDLLKNKTKSW